MKGNIFSKNYRTMNKLMVILTLTFVSHIVQAQEQRKSYFSISGGPSFPVGEFKLKDFADDRSGFAKTGGFLDVAYGYRFSRYIGAMTLLKGRVYGVDLSNYALPVGTGMGMQIETTTWRSGAVMAGLFASLPLDRWGLFEVGLKGLAGIQRTHSPKMDIRVTSSGIGAVTGRQESASSSSFSYLIGADFKYRFTHTLGLVLSVDFNSSEPRFDNVTGSVGGARIDVASRQATPSLDVGLGLIRVF